MAVVEQAAFGRAGVGVRQHFRQPGRQTNALQRSGEIGFAEVLIRYRLTALLAQFRSQFAQRRALSPASSYTLPA